MPKTIALNTIHHLIMKMLYKRKLHQIASNHLSNIEFKYFKKLYKDYNNEPF